LTKKLKIYPIFILQFLDYIFLNLNQNKLILYLINSIKSGNSSKAKFVINIYL